MTHHSLMELSRPLWQPGISWIQGSTLTKWGLKGHRCHWNIASPSRNNAPLLHSKGLTTPGRPLCCKGIWWKQMSIARQQGLRRPLWCKAISGNQESTANTTGPYGSHGSYWDIAMAGGTQCPLWHSIGPRTTGEHSVTMEYWQMKS